MKNLKQRQTWRALVIGNTVLIHLKNVNMDILLIHHCDTWGGAGVSLKICIEMLISGGHAVTVCVPHRDSEVVENLKGINLPIKIISIEEDMAMISAYNGGPKAISLTFWRDVFRIQTCKKKIENILEASNSNLVIVNSMTLSWICKLANKKAIPSLVYVRETKPKQNRVGFFMISRFINKYANGVIFISEYDRKKMNFKNKNQEVFKNSIHFEAYKVDETRNSACLRFGIDPSKIIFLYVGGDDELKGYSIITGAMRHIKDNNISLVVAGWVKESNKIKDERIKYLGKVFEMPLLYRACDVLVFPSTSAHQARPAFEAGAMGLPVIISDFPETQEDVQDGINGLSFKPSDTIDLSKKMMILLHDKDMRDKLGLKNKECSNDNHNFSTTKLRFNNFISQLINDNSNNN